MSSDPVINSALLRMCARAHDEAPTREHDGATPSDVDDNNNNGSSNVILAHDTPTAVAAAAATTATAAAPCTRRPEDYVWLRSALAAVEAPERRVKTLLERVEQPAHTRSSDELVCALDELSDLVEDINWATEFALMHGPPRIVRVLQTSPHAHTSAAVRASVAMVIAHSAQLSDALQSRYAEARACEVLLPLLLRDERDATCVAALLHACSCLCRGHAGNTVAFVQQGGLDVLAQLLRQRVPPTRRDGHEDNSNNNNDNNNVDNTRNAMATTAEMSAADNKVAARALFFLRYFAETGVSTAPLIELACQHAEHSVDTAVQCAAAAALLQLLRKSPTTVKATAQRAMPTRLRAWQALCRDPHGRRRAPHARRRGGGDGSDDVDVVDDDDARVQLAAELDRVS